VKLSTIALAALGSGVAGWILENTLFPPRSARLLGPGVPFLPVYAAGGALVAVLSPYLKAQPAVVRAAAYGASLTGLEYAVCKVDRATGGKTWDYNGACIDVPHAALWAALGLVIERVVEKLES
jgi:hypothetical protein